jgi:hypothetical protein
LEPDADGWVHFILWPRHARHLANLLVEYATYAEAESDGVPPQSGCDQKMSRSRTKRM